MGISHDEVRNPAIDYMGGDASSGNLDFGEFGHFSRFDLNAGVAMANIGQVV
jgi:hypothetical protein